MKRLLPLLLPLALFAQVEIDTVIHLPYYLYHGYFIPELNKLYINARYHLLVLDCSTYQVRADIPTASPYGYASFAWNWRRRKLYFCVAGTNIMVIDAVADTVVKRLPFVGWQAYASSIDRIYVGGGRDSTPVVDCATDSVVSWLRSPLPGYVIAAPSWDSVGNKLFVGLSRWGGPYWLAVYNCANDSLLALLDPGVLYGPGVLNFDYAHQKAYYADGSSFPGRAAVINVKCDSLIKTFPFYVRGEFNPIAVNTEREKVYIAGISQSNNAPDTLYVIDCATDSIIKKVTYPSTPWDWDNARYVPWSNRVYLGSSDGPYGIVFDCNTDSIIVPELRLGRWAPFEVQLDPIHERIFVVGADTMSVHVLRDVVPGVAEEESRGLGLEVRCTQLRDRVALGYRLDTPGEVAAQVFDRTGRRVRTLFAGGQRAGEHALVWDYTDARNRPVSPGVYFIILKTPSRRFSFKVVKIGGC